MDGLLLPQVSPNKDVDIVQLFVDTSSALGHWNNQLGHNYFVKNKC